jgi:hypothetical protein
MSPKAGHLQRAGEAVASLSELTIGESTLTIDHADSAPEELHCTPLKI